LFNKGEYYYGVVLHRNGKNDEAIEHLNKFAKSYVPKEEKNSTDNFKKLAQLEIAGCEFAKSAPKAKVKFYNAGPGVNKPYTEGAPYGIGETDLYYTSLRQDALTGTDSLIFVHGPKAKPIYQIMHSKLVDNKWTKGTAIDNKDINDPNYNVANGTFNRSQTRFYFTKCLDMDDNRSLCNIYVSDYSNGKFSNVQRLPETVNSKEAYTATQPTVRTGTDGSEIIYFSSDRPGGAGGFDIWYTTRLNNGDFKEAAVVKGPINTAGDEITPFFNDSTGTLYFSSNGLPGLGGFDIFKSTENADLSWSEPVNMGAPINTGADDLYYTRSTDQTNGFLVSNRVGSVPLNNIKTASDDIFYWTNFRFAVEGVAMKEGEGSGTLTDATFKLYKKMPDGSKVLVSVQAPRSSTSATGSNTAGGGNTSGGNTSGGSTASTGGATGAFDANAPGAYFFKLEPESDYQVVVEREGFQPRVENVTTKGLPDEDTLKENIFTRKAMYAVKGLVIEEGKPGGLKDANVELVEIYPNGMEKTVYYAKSDPNYAFDVEMNKNYKLITRKEGYFTNTATLSTSGLGTLDTIRKDLTITKLELNKAYTLQNVLYEFGKATLTENSKTVLDNLYQILVENPAFIIELSSHTDAIGSDVANMKLSQARAESCVEYLIGKGIAKDRLIAKGYGKTKPKVPNTTEDGKDDPAGRAINRRTEFQIIGLKKSQ
jgi:outer membrane protein OmpA-like peptidoglycan-associated protein